MKQIKPHKLTKKQISAYMRHLADLSNKEQDRKYGGKKGRSLEMARRRNGGKAVDNPVVSHGE